MRGRQKLLLTATPLQNDLAELHGLVSVIDETLFGSAQEFRKLYGAKSVPEALITLAERLKSVHVRHLRRAVQGAGFIRFTDRVPVTVTFEASDAEMELYRSVSAFLQGSSHAYGDKPNPLLLVTARKIIGSSTAAIEGFLARILDRLRAGSTIDLGLLESELKGVHPKVTVSKIVGQRASADPDLAAEIEEVQRLLELARSIATNTKGDLLVARLPELLDEVGSKGGQRKVVVFTESVRTQNYLAKLLADAGYAGRIVFMNGSNNDPGSRLIYESWLRGTRAPSVSRDLGPPT